MHESSIDYAECRVISFDDESDMCLKFLLIIDYCGTRQRISYQMNEFKEVFPFSGLPDTGISLVDYIPQKN